MSLNIKSKIALSVVFAGLSTVALADGWDPDSQASNIGSIANTRHNLTLSYNIAAGGQGVVMDFARNNYGAICVYCHTPHGANKSIQGAPLWNRTVNPGNYTIYDKETTLGLAGRMSLPGPNSLTCLSCHDGTIAIDSVLNMPGSGRYGNNETGTSDFAFLDTWPATSGNHFRMGNPAGAAGSVENNTCTNSACHATKGGARADFRVFVLGTDLRDDHVVGIKFPTTFGAGIDFNEPTAKVPGKWAFYDDNGNGIAEKDEVRLYDSGEGPEVECASCHDPHGVPSNGKGTRFNPSFLRVNNSGVNANGVIGDGPSALCLTCHAK